jgi:hypothetical protein
VGLLHRRRHDPFSSDTTVDRPISRGGACSCVPRVRAVRWRQGRRHCQIVECIFLIYAEKVNPEWTYQIVLIVRRSTRGIRGFDPRGALSTPLRIYGMFTMRYTLTQDGNGSSRPAWSLTRPRKSRPMGRVGRSQTKFGSLELASTDPLGQPGRPIL